MIQEKRKPGRPRKVQIIQSDTEVAATVVKPVPDPEHDPNPITVEEVDPVTEEVIAVYADPGDLVELPDEQIPETPSQIEAAKNLVSIPEGVGVEIADVQDRVEAELSPAQIVALDRDYDGEAGGSRPHAKLTELQRHAYAMDCSEAYEGQFEVKRTDAFNRVWTFRHEIVKSQDHMLVECRRGPTVSRVLISSAVFSQGRALVAIEQADAETMA